MANTHLLKLAGAISPDLKAIVALQRRCKMEMETLRGSIRELEEDQDSLKRIRVHLVSGRGAQTTHAFKHSREVVSRQCAEFFAAYTLSSALKHGRLNALSSSARNQIDAKIDLVLGTEQRAALTGSDIPLPQIYQGEVVKLVEGYGAIRKWGTIFPLTPSQNFLPRLASSPAFEFVDMSAAVPEKSPQVEFVQFTPEKAGGIVRIPSELEADSFVKLGNFLVDWIARQMAHFEDSLAFNADGSSTWKSMKGVLKYALDESRAVTLAAGAASPAEITLANVRAMRRHVASAALINGAYYFNPSFEALFHTFNDMTDEGMVFERSPAGDSLDKFPIRWVEVLPSYDSADNADALVGAFGDLSFSYLGEVGNLTISSSKQVYFSVDQVALRALARLAFNQMADDSMSALQLGAES